VFINCRFQTPTFHSVDITRWNRYLRSWLRRCRLKALHSRTQLHQDHPVCNRRNPTAEAQPPPRQTVEETRNDRTLAEFLLMLDDYEPLVCIWLIATPLSRWDHVYRSLMKWRTTICNALVLSVKTFDCTSQLSSYELLLVHTASISQETASFFSGTKVCIRHRCRRLSTCSIRTNAAGGRARSNQSLAPGISRVRHPSLLLCPIDYYAITFRTRLEPHWLWMIWARLLQNMVSMPVNRSSICRRPLQSHRHSAIQYNKHPLRPSRKFVSKSQASANWTYRMNKYDKRESLNFDKIRLKFLRCT